MTHHLVDGTEAKLGHDCAKLIGDIIEEVDDVFGRSLEFLAQFRILGSNADWAGVLMKCGS